MNRRAAAAVLATALSAAALAMSVGGAAALEPVEELVAVTSSSIVDTVVEAVTGETTTTTTSTSTSTSTTAVPESSTTTSAPSTTTTMVQSTPSTVIAVTRTTTTTTTTTLPVAPPVSASGALLPVPMPALLHESPPAAVTPSGPRSTLALLDALAEVDAPPYLVARVLAPFPVAGRAHFTDDWGALRHGPPVHDHQGTDIFAPRGTPVIAAMDGVVERMTTTGRLGGTSLRVTVPSGTFFYYAHLDRFAPMVSEGRAVRAGEVIGFVGNTGNAASTPPHLHFEIHPRGGAAVSPVPYLDRWLAEATVTARAIIGTSAIDAVVRPLVIPTPEPTAPVRARRASPLTMTPIDPRPVAAIDATPMVALGAVVLVSWLAPRRHRLRRLTGASR